MAVLKVALGRSCPDPVAAAPPKCYIGGMSTALRAPTMTREEFLSWVERQELRHEFDGFVPVAMVGGTLNHSLITGNLNRALFAALAGTGCRVLGYGAGLATAGDAVRYPDALVTGTAFDGRSRLTPGVIAVFEVLSPRSARTDRIVKLREYAAVPSIRQYVILEHESAAVTVFDRDGPEQPWSARALTAEDGFLLPVGTVRIAVAALYADIAFPPDETERG